MERRSVSPLAPQADARGIVQPGRPTSDRMDPSPLEPFPSLPEEAKQGRAKVRGAIQLSHEKALIMWKRSFFCILAISSI